MHDPVRDDDASFSRIRPLLLAQLGQQLDADRVVPLVLGCLDSAAGQYLEQVGAADDADNLAVVHHRDPLDSSRFHEFGDLAKAGQFPTLTTSRVMTSSTRRACDLTYSAASRAFENHSLQRERRRSVPVSAGRSRSPSVMIPTSCPFLSRTGTPLMRRLIMSLATSSTVVSGFVVATALTITSLALISFSPLLGQD